MRICIVRSDTGYHDSRIAKEMYALSSEHEVFLLGWNRELSGDSVIRERRRIRDREFDFYLIPEPAAYGGGMKRMIGPMRRFWRKAYKFLSENRDKYDVLHAVNYDTVRPAYRAAKRFGKKIVYDIFDYYADSYNAPQLIKGIIRRSENSFINRADMTVICSGERREQIAGSHPKDLIVVLNTPEDTAVSDSFELNSGSVPGRARVVYAGMLVFDRFLRETANVMMSRSDIEWHVAGYGVLQPYIEECAASHENIFYYGPLAYGDILALESKCDIMTALQDPSVPNNRYPAPNKFYEALMLGKPIIMVRNGSLYKEIEREGFGEVVDTSSGDIEGSISSALDRLMARRNDWADMGAAARKLYEEQYPWSRSAETLLEGYRRLI